MNTDEFMAKNPSVMLAWPSIRKEIDNIFRSDATIMTSVLDEKLLIKIYTSIWPLESLAAAYVTFDEWLKANHREAYPLIEFETFWQQKIVKKSSEMTEELLKPLVEAKSAEELVEELGKILEEVDDLEVN